MELLDIVDENNILTGEAKDRKTMHEQGLWHRHVSCWIMNENGELLFQKRAACKDRNANRWSKTGGHVESGETVEQAIIREVEEEIGIHLDEEKLQLIDVFKSKEKNNKYFAYDYFAIVEYKIEEYILQVEEVSEVKYYSIEEIEKLKNDNDENYTFSKWCNDDFNNKMRFLKEKRAKLKNALNLKLDIK